MNINKTDQMNTQVHTQTHTKVFTTGTHTLRDTPQHIHIRKHMNSHRCTLRHKKIQTHLETHRRVLKTPPSVDSI